MDIKKGDKFLCIKTVHMVTDGEVAYRQCEVYESEIDGCITDLQNSTGHYWKGEKPEEFFVPVEKPEPEVYDNYGSNLLYPDLKVAVAQSHHIVTGVIREITKEDDRVNVFIDVDYPAGVRRLTVCTNYHYGDYPENGICMSEILVLGD